MPHRSLGEQLLADGVTCSAAEAEQYVPSSPGYYAIFVITLSAMPAGYAQVLRVRRTRLIYIGIAKSSLYQRLVEQDLRHKRPSTFFRGIGAIWGYRPAAGSLYGRKNQNNYKFSRADTDRIIHRINEKLCIRWIKVQSVSAELEAHLIRCYRPLLNTVHNSEPVSELSRLRLSCRQIAACKCTT